MIVPLYDRVPVRGSVSVAAAAATPIESRDA